LMLGGGATAACATAAAASNARTAAIEISTARRRLRRLCMRGFLSFGSEFEVWGRGAPIAIAVL
jgi:hypothetical protein